MALDEHVHRARPSRARCCAATTTAAPGHRCRRPISSFSISRSRRRVRSSPPRPPGACTPAAAAARPRARRADRGRASPRPGLVGPTFYFATDGGLFVVDGFTAGGRTPRRIDPSGGSRYDIVTGNARLLVASTSFDVRGFDRRRSHGGTSSSRRRRAGGSRRLSVVGRAAYVGTFRVLVGDRDGTRWTKRRAAVAEPLRRRRARAPRPAPGSSSHPVGRRVRRRHQREPTSASACRRADDRPDDRR